MQQHQEDGQDLRHGVGLAQPAGPENLHGPGDVEQSADDHDDGIAAEDQNRDPPFDLSHRREHQEHGAEQQLVGNRIQVLAERGLLLHQAGQQAVQPVTDAGDDEDCQRPAIVAAQHGDHGKGHKDQPQQREQVGRGTQLPDHF